MKINTSNNVRYYRTKDGVIAIQDVSTGKLIATIEDNLINNNYYDEEED